MDCEVFAVIDELPLADVIGEIVDSLDAQVREGADDLDADIREAYSKLCRIITEV